MSSRRHVTGGYCQSSSVSFCALELEQCPVDDFPNMIFVSTRRTGGFYGICRGREETEEVFIGKCDTNKCAVDAASCDTMYIPIGVGSFYPECQIKSALFGNCNGRCVWSSKECTDSETYVLPSNPDSYVPTDTDCTCHNVQVGGCKNEGQPVYCAVSANSCDATQTWLSPQDVVEQESVTCYLCRSPDTVRPSSSPTRSPITQPTVTTDTTTTTTTPSPSPPSPPTITTTNNNRSSNTNSKNDSNNSTSNNSGLIVGVAVGGSLIVLLPLIAAFILFRRRRNNQKETYPPPPTFFDSKNQGVRDDEELSMT